MTTIILLLVLLGSCVIYWAIVEGVSSLFRGWGCERLSKLRDEAWDAGNSGKIPNETAKEIVKDCEKLISESEKRTFSFGTVLLYGIFSGRLKPPKTPIEIFDTSTANEAEKELIKDFEKEFLLNLGLIVLLGSFTGILFTCAIVILALLTVPSKNVSYSAVAKDTLREKAKESGYPVFDELVTA